MKNKVKMVMVLTVLMMVCTLCACSRKNLQSYTWYTAFDTETKLSFYAADDEAEALAEQFEAELTRYHQIFDIYHDYKDVNNIKTINDQAGTAPVKVDKEVAEMLKLCRDIDAASGGKANAAMGSVLSLWHDYRMAGMEDPENAVLPPAEALEAASGHTDIGQMVIDEEEGTVYLEDDQMSLDVGAVAKGYATARLGEFLREKGVTSALLDVGGNILAVGEKEDGSPWRIALQNPDLSAEKSYIHVIRLADRAMVTSGDYQRYYTVDGEKYHHIIDPETLMPSAYFTSVSVIASDSGMADALSTALFSMDESEGREMLERFECDVEVLWVYKDGSESMTEGFKGYLEE